MPERCEYDEAPLVYDDEGREDTCSECEADIAKHRGRCFPCRLAGDPDDMTGVQE